MQVNQTLHVQLILANNSSRSSSSGGGSSSRNRSINFDGGFCRKNGT